MDIVMDIVMEVEIEDANSLILPQELSRSMTTKSTYIPMPNPRIPKIQRIIILHH